MNDKRPTLLMILDGYGLCADKCGNAIAAAEKPVIDRIFDEYPNTAISASGIDVGLPAGQMGNSEVGHLNIGAGRIVYQDLSRISIAIEKGSFFEDPILLEAMTHSKNNGSALHLNGLLSDGGVHSHIDHLFALIDMAKRVGLKDVRVNCFLDGRDVPPCCAGKYIELLEKHIQIVGLGRITSISGRYYAMDRDNRWDREKLAYDALTKGEGYHADTAADALAAAYGRGENDEFVKPTVIGNETTVSDGDSVIMFNFRPDRAREITRAFTDDKFTGFERDIFPDDLFYVSMTEYDSTLINAHIAFPPETIVNTLGEYISGLGLKQLRIAETEKYAHVTMFFNGGVESPNKNEDRILVPSPKVATYDLKPEMSAFEVKDKVIEQIMTGKYDLIVLNFANADMVGHTGVFDAAVKAIEALDVCVGEIKNAVLEKGGRILLTADHGNADIMEDNDGNPVTKHSTSPVPVVLISDEEFCLRSGGRLADIAPTLLDLMGIEKPAEMTGESLIERDD